MFKDVFKRKVKSPTVLVTLIGMMGAVTCIATYLIQVPIPQTMGYFNVGDAIIFTSAILFGPVVGFFSGGLGAAISDMLGGYMYFAPITFVVKGIEGFLVGLISNGKDLRRDILAVIFGGAEMITGYYLAEAFILGFGLIAALVEVPFNLLQIVIGGVVSIPLSLVARRYLAAEPLRPEEK